MASPQIENGYTRIANELFDALCRTNVSGEAMRVFNTILRKTYGFGKKEDLISLGQIAKHTGIARSNVARALNTLVKAKMVRKTIVSGINALSVNKNFDEWGGVIEYDTTKSVIETDNTSAIETDSKSAIEIDTHKRKKEKEQKKPAAARQEKDAKFNPLGAKIIKAFEAVDPKNKTKYNNTTERAACDFLIAEYGLSEVLKRISFLPKSNAMPMFPSINSPNELKEKWVKLQNQVERYKAERGKQNINTKGYVI
jgi:phage replication O-like protein O